jgi:hypothetical protein
MTYRQAAVIVALATVGMAGGAMPAASTQARDVSPPPTGTCVLGGIVVSDEPARPVSRAIVTLNGGNIRLQPATLTNDDGAFVFANLPEGRFTIMVSKPGYVMNYYGAQRPRSSALALPLVLTEGQRITNLQVRLPRGAVITGTFRDQYGRPQPDTIISVDAARMALGQFVGLGQDGGYSITDDRGVYRIYGLMAGSYVVSATNPGSNLGNRLATNEELQWAEQRSGTAPPPGPTVTLAPVFYPGTVDRQSATVVTVSAGEERAGIDFASKLVPTTKLDGVVLMPDGQPAAGLGTGRGSAGVELRMRNVTQEGEMSLTRITRPGPDGRFSMPALTPGRYGLSARLTAGRAGGEGLSPAEAALWADQDVVVDGQDLPEVRLQLQPGMTVSGRVVFDGTTPQSDVSRVFIGLSSSRETPSSIPGVTPGADGTFSVAGVPPGQYRLEVTGPGGTTSKWTLQSARAKSQNVIDKPFEVRPNENAEGIVVTFTDRPTEVSGTLFDSANRPAAEYFVMMFSADRTLWTPRSRVVRAPVRADSTGKFTIAGLPAGDYYICALPDFEPSVLNDPSFLEQLVPGSIMILLAEGEKRKQDLRLAVAR